MTRRALKFTPALGLAGAVLLSAALAGAEEPRESWRVSCYAYRDVNRSGVFDMGDFPYADLAVEITRPDGSMARQVSNISGFTNFEMSATQDNVDIYSEGVHQVHAVVPPGWQSTSEKSEQLILVRKRPNVGGGMIIEGYCDPIGIAPILTIEGKLASEGGPLPENYTVTAESDDGDSYRVPLDDFGNFSLNADPGTWRLTVSDEAGKTLHEREVEVSDSAVILSTIELDAESTAPLESPVETISFDDLPTTDTLFEIPFGYNGLNWKNWIATHNKFYNGGGYMNGTVSSQYIAYNSSGYPSYMWRDEPFDFVGSYVSVAWLRGAEDDVIVRAWRGDELAYEDRLRLSPAGGTYFDANYLGITRLGFEHGNYERIVLDDFKVRK